MTGRELPELGILFMGSMVRALLANLSEDPAERAIAKTCTRRLPKHQPVVDPRGALQLPSKPLAYLDEVEIRNLFGLRCRYSPVGRRLWVKETFNPDPHGTIYRADLSTEAAAFYRWTPSILMPRVASRITLQVRDIRAERLLDITEGDVQREGFVHAGLGHRPEDYHREFRTMHKLTSDATPWVWRVGFDVVP